MQKYFFSPLYIETLTSMIVKILGTKKIGMFNLGSINKISKSNFILKVAKKLKIKLNYKKIDFKINQKLMTKRPLNMPMNVSKFQKEFFMKLPSIKS